MGVPNRCYVGIFMSRDSTGSSSFGRIRQVLWPVHRHELSKMLPMFFMIFLICFNYTIVRNMKDALVVTAKASGAEVIPFLKVWAILPSAFLATFIYTRLSNKFSQEKVFYFIVATFLIYFLLFAFVLYPARDAIHPYALADRLQGCLPLGFRWFIAMLRNWTLTSFYIMSELWSVMVLTILFWGFANQVMEVPQAKRFYSLFTLSGNAAATVAGYLGAMMCQGEWRPNFYGHDSWEQTVVASLVFVAMSGVVIMWLFWWVNKYVVRRHMVNTEAHHMMTKPARTRRSLRASFKYLATSKYLICIAVLVVSYNLIINLVEVVWKDRLRQLCPLPQDFNTYMNHLSTWMGIVSTLTSLFISVMMHKAGWRFTAMITPVVIFITCALFFLFLFLPDNMTIGVSALLGMTPLSLVVLLGGLQNCMTKAMKYSVFDASKEIAFIPLPQESKLKGKAAIDGVGSRLGKSGGSVIHQGLLMIFGTLLAGAPVVSGIIMVIVGAWITAVRALDKEFHELSSEEEIEKLEERQGVAAAVS